MGIPREVENSLFWYYMSSTVSLTHLRFSRNSLTERTSNILPSVLANARRYLYFCYPTTEPPSYISGWRFVGDKELGGTQCLVVTSSGSGSVQRQQCLGFFNQAGLAA